MKLTLGNTAPLEPDGSPAACGETVTEFDIPHDDYVLAIAEVRDAWPRHSAADPSFIAGEPEELALLLKATLPWEVRDAD